MDREGRTALHRAITTTWVTTEQEMETIRLLTSHLISLTIPNNAGETPADLMTSQGLEQQMEAWVLQSDYRLLQQRGCNIKVRTGMVNKADM